jgi:hypothetical protein
MFFLHFQVKVIRLIAVNLLFCVTVGAQNKIALTDLSFFKQPASCWRIAGDVKTDLYTKNLLKLSDGAGILVNLPDTKNPGTDLYTNIEHGDVDVELDYMMAKGSNSGIYLSGNYEIQLLDSWGITQTKSGDNGGIYARWDESRGKGREAYEGFAPRQSVSKAPGLWQHLKISFQAPRFDSAGNKIQNARMLRVELNGVTIHENVELTGPTRGSMGVEKATGPLRFQGDHGPVAFRNISITNYNKPRPELINLKYSVYKGLHDNESNYAKSPPEAEGPSVIVSANLEHLPDTFVLRYTGTLRVKEPGEYNFNFFTAAGLGLLKINNQVIAPLERRNKPVKAILPAGDLPFELLYSKFLDWAKPSLGLAIAGPGIREYLISDINNPNTEQVDAILVEATKNTLLRSFMDIPGHRIVHAVSVGGAGGVHYTYDMDHGAIAQVWRGGFLDATPMWHERGDGSSRPTGSVLLLDTQMLNIGILSSTAASWKTDTTGTGFRPKGYTLDVEDRPVFRYLFYGSTVSDTIKTLENNAGISREIAIEKPIKDLYARLAVANKIEDIGNGLYLLDDKSYYLRIDEAAGVTPVIRDASNKKELIIPVRSKIKYSIFF